MIHAFHGNLGHPSDWNEVEKALGAGFEWHKPNLWDSPIVSFKEWADRTNDFAEALDPEPILMGYSLGGRLAMNALSRAKPPLWNSVIFVSAHPGIPDFAPAARAARVQSDACWARTLREAGPEKFLREWNAQDVLSGQPISSRQEIAAEMYREPIAQAFETWSLGVQADLRQQLLDCDVPQLWVVGEEDTKFRAIAEAAVLSIPSAELSVIERCGHRVLLQKPLELAKCVHEFLTKQKTTTHVD